LPVDLTTITVAQFKARFNRDFNYLEVASGNYIWDQDILNAYMDAQGLFNQGLYQGQNALINAYLYLSAHCLCVNLKMANQGINGVGVNVVSGKNVGGSSESYTIPAEYTNDATLALYTRTQYGMKYLALTLPQTRGNITSVRGGVQPGSDNNGLGWNGDYYGG
jgi:hypothetical protein